MKKCSSCSIYGHTREKIVTNIPILPYIFETEGLALLLEPERAAENKEAVDAAAILEAERWET